MLRRRSRISREAVVFFVLAVFLFAVVRLFVYVEHNIRPTILSIASVQADKLATEAINNAINEKVVHSFLYQDLIIIEKNRDGRIVMAQTNNMEVNRLMAETTLRVQRALTDLAGVKIHIPLGQAFNSYILANVGPRIPITLTPVGLVNTNLEDRFEDAGINQVRHKIYLTIDAEMQIVIPFISSITEVSTTVPIVDAIYPGEVPDTVINLQFPNGQMVPAPFPTE